MQEIVIACGARSLDCDYDPCPCAWAELQRECGENTLKHIVTFETSNLSSTILFRPLFPSQKNSSWFGERKIIRSFHRPSLLRFCTRVPYIQAIVSERHLRHSVGRRRCITSHIWRSISIICRAVARDSNGTLR
jgi:hypothetical protein